MEDNIWYYKDRIGLPRGPLQLSHLRACWVNGTVDEATLVWGQGLESWYPICNVEGLEVNIKSLDVVVAKWAYDKFFLRPRLARVRAQRKEAVRAVKQGRLELPPAFVEQMKAEAPGLGFDKLGAPHPSIRVLAEEIERAKREAAAAKIPKSLACLTLALPVAGWR